MGSQPGPPPRASLTVACRAHLAASSLLGSQCSREGQTQSGIHSPPPLLPWPGAGLPPGAGQRGPGIPLPCWQVQLAHQTPQTPPRGFSVCMQGLCQLVPKGGVGHSGGRRASKDFRDGGERGTREGNSGGKEQSRGRESRAGRRETAEPPGPARSCPWGDGLGGVAQGHLCRCSPGTHCEVPSVPRTVVASWVQKKRRAALTQARPTERHLGPSPGHEGETLGMGRGPRGAWAGLPGRPEGSRARTTGPAKRPRLGPRGEGPGAYPGVDGRRGLCTPSGLTQCSPSARVIARVAHSPVTARLSPCPGPVGRAPPRRVHGPVVATGLASSILLIQSRDGARTAQLRPRVWCWGSSGLWKPFGMLTRAQGALKVWGDRDSLGRVCFRTDS